MELEEMRTRRTWPEFLIIACLVLVLLTILSLAARGCAASLDGAPANNNRAVMKKLDSIDRGVTILLNSKDASLQVGIDKAFQRADEESSTETTP